MAVIWYISREIMFICQYFIKVESSNDSCVLNIIDSSLRPWKTQLFDTIPSAGVGAVQKYMAVSSGLVLY